MNSRVRFVQGLSLGFFLFSGVILLGYSIPLASDVSYTPSPTFPRPLAGTVIAIVVGPVTTRQSVYDTTATWEAELATWEANYPELFATREAAFTATWEAERPTREAELATREAELATWEAGFAMWEAERPTREAELATREAELATWEAEFATWEAGYATWEAERTTREIVLLPKQVERAVGPPVDSTTFTYEIQPPSTDWTLINLWFVTLISLGTFVTTTFYRTWDERRTRAAHVLTTAKTQLEIEKLRKEVEEAQQKGKKR